MKVYQIVETTQGYDSDHWDHFQTEWRQEICETREIAEALIQNKIQAAILKFIEFNMNNVDLNSKEYITEHTLRMEANRILISVGTNERGEEEFVWYKVYEIEVISEIPKPI